MTLNNSLNVSELLRRLGVKGDSLGSAPLLESLRLSLQIGDLSDLVPPLLGAIGTASILQPASGIGNVNKWNLRSRSPGGVTVRLMSGSANTHYRCWVTAVNPIGVVVATAQHNLSFGQIIESAFTSRTAAPAVAPPNVFSFGGTLDPKVDSNFDNWIGPSEFFNIETEEQNASQRLSIVWKEYPAALNPG